MAWGPPVPERPPSLISAILALSADGVGDVSLGDILNTSDQWRASPSFLGGRNTGGPGAHLFPILGREGTLSLQKARAPTADSAGTAVTLKVDAGDAVHPATVKTYPAFFPVAQPLSMSMA